jgi:hypothetical protein
MMDLRRSVRKSRDLAVIAYNLLIVQPNHDYETDILVNETVRSGFISSYNTNLNKV